MIHPKVSVIIPCYNLGCYLPEAIESVLKQDFDQFEIVVVDDGSTDPQTLDILNKYSDHGVMVLKTTNHGPSVARNKGISHAGGKYILPLDADDKLAPDFIKMASEILDGHPDVGIVYGQVELFGSNSGLWKLPEFSPERLLFDNMIVATAMFRREDWISVGGYSRRMVYGWEDWDFWLSLVEYGRRVVCLSQVALQYRIRDSSRTESMVFYQKLAMFCQLLNRHWRLYYRHWPAFFRKLANSRDSKSRLRKESQ